jgi:hypothetical protein
MFEAPKRRLGREADSKDAAAKLCYYNLHNNIEQKTLLQKL